MLVNFSELEYAAKKKVNRCDRFLDEIDTVPPWSALVAEIEPYYPRCTGRGRPQIGVERMLRMYSAQQCFGLSDQECLRSEEVAVQRTCQEHGATLHAVRSGQSADCQATTAGVSHPRCILKWKTTGNLPPIRGTDPIKRAKYRPESDRLSNQSEICISPTSFSIIR